MTATLHKITAGDGYEYYTRHVAAHDADERGGLGLNDYYSARGESPGRWMGSGLAGLTVKFRGRDVPVSVVAEGEEVSAEQMKSLFGLGMHPQADSIQPYVIAQAMAHGATQRQAVYAAGQAAALGQRFRVYEPSPFRTRCAQAFTEFNLARGRPGRAPIDDADRARIRTAVAEQMFRQEFGRDPLNDRELSAWVARHGRQTTTAVAGYGWGCSPPKTVSVLWALAPRPKAEMVEAAHRAAVADALAFLESHAAFTRKGRNGVEQVEVEGLIAAVFEHRDSRAGDPDLHTHVVVSNKVRTRVDGKWRTIDGSMFYRAAVAASEVYNTRLELYLYHLLGVRFAERVDSATAGKRAVREIVGVDEGLARAWSQRRAQVAERLDELTVAFQRTHGREPIPVEMYRLDQRAVLATRGRKQHRSHAEQRRMWSEEAVEVLGSRAAVHRMIADVLSVRAGPGTVIDQAWIQRCADKVVAEVSRERASWRRWHIRAEVERRIRGHVNLAQWQRVAEAVTAAALSPARSIPRGDPDRHAEPVLRAPPAVFTRSDGTSIFRSADHLIYTSPMVLDLEARLIEMTQHTGGHVLAPVLVDAAIDAHNRDPANRDKQLNEGQIAMVREFATSGRSLQFGNAPAGSGKTSAMRVLTNAWHADGGSVLGLAPTARAAAVLQADTEVRVATVDKLLHVLTEHLPTPQQVVAAGTGHRPPTLPQWILDIGTDTLVIVDEHMQIADLPRLRMLNYLLSRGATVRLIGDDQQLSAIDAAGAAGDMMRATTPVSLTHVVRFADTAEASASLMLRAGDTAALGFYLDRDRVHVGAPGAVVDAAFTAWLTDDEAGMDSIMLAPTHSLVSELNTLARAHRLAAHDRPEREVLLADELSASVGDIIRTGLNDPRLRVGPEDYVRNGYQWVVAAVHPDGAVTATQLLPGRELGHSVHLPADYVRTRVRLGYAATIDSAQGTTVDSCHVVLTGAESRNQLYVALTRGRLANHLYLTTAVDGSEQSFLTDRAARPRTAVDILVQVLSRDGAAVSAHTELHRARDPFHRLGHAVDVYLDALELAAQDLLGPDPATQLDAAAEKALPGLTLLPGYPGLRRHLMFLAVAGRDPIAELAAVIGARELATADNVCAVLRWRLDPTGTDSTPPGPLPWLPGVPRPLAEHPDIGEYVQARYRIVTAVAAQIREQARTFTPATAPVWARPLVGTDPDLLAEVAVWRAALHIPDTDLRPCGPARHPAPERRHHDALTVRVTEAIGDVNIAINLWSAAAKRVDARVLDDPYWPILAERLDLAARAGIDIDTLLDTAAAGPPLPDTMAAAALWFRLDLDLDTLDTGPGAPLAPQWAEELRAVLGTDPAEHLLREPGWPRLVAALERVTTLAGFTAHDALATATELIAEHRSDDTDTLRPHQYVIALAWRIDLLTHHHASLPKDTPAPEAPPEPEHTPPDPHDNLFPDDDPTLHTEAPLPPPVRDEQPDSPAETGTFATPQPGHPDPAAIPAAGTELDDSDDEQNIRRRIEATLRSYPFLTARAHLQQAAIDNPHARTLIEAGIPASDPGLYRPPTDARGQYRGNQPSTAGQRDVPESSAPQEYVLAPELVRATMYGNDIGDVWAPLARTAPQWLREVMYMNSVVLPDGRIIHGYKHHVTRRYLCLDEQGQPWHRTTTSEGNLNFTAIALHEALAYADPAGGWGQDTESRNIPPTATETTPRPPRPEQDAAVDERDPQAREPVDASIHDGDLSRSQGTPRQGYTVAPRVVRPTVDYGVWTPVEKAAPQLLDVLMYISTHVLPDNRLIHHYKHATTGGYLSLDNHEQPWRVTSVGGGRLNFAPIPLPEALADLHGQPHHHRLAEPATPTGIDDLSDEQQRTVRRIEATFDRYPLSIARARLQHASASNLQIRELLYLPNHLNDPEPHRPDTADTTSPAATTTEAKPSDAGAVAAFDAVAALFSAGAERTARAELADLTDEQRLTLRRIATTFRTYPFPIARARLGRAAAQADAPETRALIEACIPDHDPGLYRPDTTTQRRTAHNRPRRKVSTRVDPTRITSTRRQDRNGDRDVHAYFAHRTELSPGNDADHRGVDPDAEYGSGDIPTPEFTFGPDLPCVECGLERPLLDPAGRAHTDGYDDGLCGDCRGLGATGIPAHPPGHTLIARCMHIIDNHPHQEALAHLRQLWRRIPRRERGQMTRWIRENEILTPPAPSTRIDTGNPLLGLTDTQLDAAVDQTHLAIALDANLQMATTGATRPATSETTPLETRPLEPTALEAIAKVHSSAQAVSALQSQIRAVSAAASQTRAELVRARRPQRRQLETRLRELGRDKEELRADLATARRDADAARRHAELLAGPEQHWDTRTRATATGAQPTPATAPAPQQPSPPQPPAHLQRRLEDLHTEQHRRTQLTPDQQQLEDTYRRDHPDTPSTSPRTDPDTVHRQARTEHDNGPGL